MESPITGFSHLQMNVRDLATSRAWFETVLGMESFVELDDTVALKHAPSRMVLVLSQRAIDPDSLSPLDHLAFAVPDGETLEAWAQELTVRGIAHDGVVLELGKPSLQLRDPNGNAIELVAPAPRT
ncbi:MAG: VOC family protein [Acidobacteria bacterium]|nr:VOC family protein [Acidobacteriota bacterium]